jgi:cell division initiation protein
MTPPEKISPATIRQQEFSTGWRGFAPIEVKAFLEVVADTVAALMQENQSLRDDLARQQNDLNEFKDRERLLKDTLINAQQIIETMKDNAQKDAEILVREAELKAEKILQESFSRQAKINNDINELKRIKTAFAAQLRGILESYQRLLAESEAAE